jgi:hypothetical protein
MSGHHHTAYGGPVVLDIGGAMGALVLRASPAAAGHEIEISPVEEPESRRHVAVHPRDIGGTVVHAAVFPELVWGHYQLWSPDGVATMTVSIAGGRVTEATWPG